MNRHYRLLSIHLLTILLPCAVIGLLGFKWLQLEREAETRRGKEAAEAEANSLRKAALDHLTGVARQISPQWRRQPGQPSFAPPPPAPPIVASAYLFDPAGRLLYPNYEQAYRQAIREYSSAVSTPQWQRFMHRVEWLEARGQNGEARQALQQWLNSAHSTAERAWVLLNMGRLSLADKQYATTEQIAARIFQCCAGARDEYGVSFAFYAASQLIAAYRSQGQLRSKLPLLASQIEHLLEAGHVGHPRDALEISALLSPARGEPVAGRLIALAEGTRVLIGGHIETGKRLEKWFAASPPLDRDSRRLFPAALWNHDRPQILGLYRTPDSELLAMLLSTDQLAVWIGQRAASGDRFDGSLAPSGAKHIDTIFQAALWPEAPGLDVVLRPKPIDPATHGRRRVLFASALAAAIVLIALLGYFALRDFSRELQLSSLRSSFIAGVTHELKTPLASIRLLAETLQLGRTRSPADANELLETIVDESERLTRLLDNVLSFSKIEKGAFHYRPVEIALSEAIHQAVERFRYILKQEGFHLAEDIDGARLHAYADPDALNQALLNLLGNAIKYSGRSRDIRLGLRARDGLAEISVTDYGMGIEPAEQRRIFESFYRVPAAAKETAGAGLGLSLVRHFAEAHGGRVTVLSEPSKGSTFSLWLPLRKNPANDNG